ncbi:hypothetical protein B0H13DRAFT_1864208 [Mycena leptocephala]|nr:hypothetical protein B0H13DRAFT_1864208 [Mycena leptocephala]
MWQSAIGEQNREMAEFCPRFQQNGRTIMNATSKRAQERKPDVARDVHPLHVQDDIQERWVRAQHRENSKRVSAGRHKPFRAAARSVSKSQSRGGSGWALSSIRRASVWSSGDEEGRAPRWRRMTWDADELEVVRLDDERVRIQDPPRSATESCHIRLLLVHHLAFDQQLFEVGEIPRRKQEFRQFITALVRIPLERTQRRPTDHLQETDFDETRQFGRQRDWMRCASGEGGNGLAVGYGGNFAPYFERELVKVGPEEGLFMGMLH